MAINMILQSFNDDLCVNIQSDARNLPWADEADRNDVSHVSATPSVVADDSSSSHIVREEVSMPTGDNLSINSSLRDVVNSQRGDDHQTALEIHVIGDNNTPNSIDYTARIATSSRTDALVDEDGFRRVLTKSQMCNWRKKLSKQKQRLQPIPYGPIVGPKK